MPSISTPPQRISSTRMEVAKSSCRKSANPGSISLSSIPFHVVKPGGGVYSVLPYQSIQPNDVPVSSFSLSSWSAVW